MKIQLIDECKALWWRLASVRVMAFWGVLGAVIVQMWPVAQWALNEILPHNPLWRIPFAALTMGLTFGSMLFARLKSQPKLQGKTDAQV